MDENQLKEIYPVSYNDEHGNDEILTIKENLN
jgi:hypothetical protein